MFSKSITAVVGAALATITFDQARATDYLFRVSCQSRRFVVQWSTGSIDPGKEYLRAVTGTKNADCMISDYNARTDANLPRERYSDWGGVVQGAPPVVIICAIFHC
jgi:hypothetical protein